MTFESSKSAHFGLPILQGVLPINGAQVPAEIIAGITLAALVVPELMGYTKIAGTPVITGLYTMLIPMALFAIFGSARYLVVGADSATAAILVSWALALKAHVHVLGTVPSGLPHIGLPEVKWTWELVHKLVPTAFAMFIVILAQSAATSRAYAARYNERFNENTDLAGLALANIGAGLSGTFVVNGSPTKTQMVDSAGGRTQLSLIVPTVIVLPGHLCFRAIQSIPPLAEYVIQVFLLRVAPVARVSSVRHESLSSTIAGPSFVAPARLRKSIAVFDHYPD